MKSFFVLIAVTACLSASATRFYVSTSGDDQNTGRKPDQAWKTLDHVNQSIRLLKPGDSILFKSGDVFDGTLIISVSGTAKRPIYIGRYGSGDLPVVSGAQSLKQWTTFGKNLWYTSFTPGNVNAHLITIDDKPFAPGRYPNNGYRTLHCENGCAESIRDSLLNFEDNHWNGGEVVVRSGRWTIDRVPINTQRKGEITLKKAPTYKVPTGGGYFITNHLETLDKDGEWFYETATHRLYLYSSSDPTNKRIQASTKSYGFEMRNVGYVTMENIHFNQQQQAGGVMENTKHVLLLRLRITNSSRNGLDVINSQYPWVENCRIEGSANNGVIWQNVKNGNFNCNEIYRTGMMPGLGENGDGTYIAVSLLDGSDNVMFQNRIEDTGYIGIDFRSGNSTLNNNFVNRFCLLKDDGGGIYTWKTAKGGNIIENNIITAGIGAGPGTPDAHRVYASGIYIDDLSSDIIVRNNTVSKCALAGIYVHNAGQITITGNKLFGNGYNPGNRDKGQLYLRYDDIAPWPHDLSPRLRVRENTFAPVNEDSYCVFLRTRATDNIKRMGLFSDNVFAAQSPGQAISSVIGGADECRQNDAIDLETWQMDTSHEEASKYIRTPPTTKLGDNLVSNSAMTRDANGWIVWPEGSVLQYDEKQLAGPAIKVTPENNEGEVLLYHPQIKLTGKTYRLSFIAQSTEPSEVGFSMIMAQSPWATVSEYACFKTDGVYQAYTFYFSPYESAYGKETRINFKSTSTFWIDNVSLTEVIEEPNTAESAVQLFYNIKDTSSVVPLSGSYMDLSGKSVNNELRLAPFGSAILVQRGME